MSLKSLFGRGKGSQKTESQRDFSQYLEDVESVGYIEEYIKDRLRVKSHTDFSIPEEFVQYGSLEEYYDAGIKRIQQLYPYDGTLREKVKFFNDSSGFDLHLFEKEYPRSNGYIKLSDNRPGGEGWGTRTSVSGNYGNPATKEYIFFKGGPNIGNIYHTASSRFSNLAIGGIYLYDETFWEKFDSAVAERGTDFSISDINRAYITEKNARLVSVGKDTWVDCGTPETLLEASIMAKDGKLNPNPYRER